MIRDLLLSAAALGSHSNAGEAGFRAKDIRFLYELFANWLVSHAHQNTIQIHNTQISRYITQQLTSAKMHRIPRNKNQSFTLTRLGLIDTIESLNRNVEAMDFLEFIFSYYFLSSYGDRLRVLIDRKGSGFSSSVRIELGYLLDHKRLIEQRQLHLKNRLEKLKARMHETKELIQFVQKRLYQKESHDLIISEAAQLYSYELNAQKPMQELMQEVPAELRLHELSQGNEMRVNVLWSALRADLEFQIKFLEQMR